MPTFPNGAPLVQVRSLLNDTGLRKNNFTAQEAPTASYDERFGWEVGSRILFDGLEYVCLDATANAADWQLATDGAARVIAEEAKDAAVPLASFSAAVSAPKPSPQNRIGAIVEGQLQEWLRDPAGTALGGGWKAAGATTARAFGGDLAAAHATGTPVDYGDLLWANDESSGYYNLYGTSKYRTVSGQRLQFGRNANPVNDPRPVYAVTKFSSANRNTDPSAWDQTAIFTLVKKTGDAFGAALTGHARSDGGDGDMIGVHARASRYTANGRGYGLWAYFAGHVESTQPGHAMEVNGFTTYDPGYGSTHQLVRLVMADSTATQNRFGTAISIGPATLGGDNNGFHTGIRVEANAIVRTSGDDGEFMRIDGPISASGSIGGIRFAKGNAGHLGIFKYALRTDEATFGGNDVVRLGSGQRVSWFTDGTRTTSITGGSSTVTINANSGISLPDVAANGVGVSVGGNRVLSTRQAAIPNATAGTEIATINAILAAMRAHGSIAS